ncbi:hypothetical protein V2J09_007169, partial [Rumex salicifolius]
WSVTRWATCRRTLFECNIVCFFEPNGSVLSFDYVSWSVTRWATCRRTLFECNIVCFFEPNGSVLSFDYVLDTPLLSFVDVPKRIYRRREKTTTAIISRLAMDLKQSISNQTDVSLAIAHHVSSIEAKGSNLVFSPLSLHVMVSMIAAGAKGPTLDQLLSFLKSKSADEVNALSSELVSVVFTDGSTVGGPKLSFANSLWVDQTLPLKPSFKQVVDNLYKAASRQVDFRTKAVEVTSEVNSWAEKETSGLIKDVLPPGAVDHTTRLIFANALYFKGSWTEQFDASKTKEDDFHLLGGTSVKAPFMTSKKKQLVSTFDGFKVVGLPYKQGQDKRQFSMYILLPDAKDGLSTMVEKLHSQSGFLDRHLPTEKVEVNAFKLPRFKIAFGFDASSTLKGLGVSLPFTEGGLTEMVDSPDGQNLYVSSIFQKSFIEVNEEGTEAAAASAAVVNLRSISLAHKVDFVADHPFLFLIREDMTGVVLFVGHILNPLTE